MAETLCHVSLQNCTSGFVCKFSDSDWLRWSIFDSSVIFLVYVFTSRKQKTTISQQVMGQDVLVHGKNMVKPKFHHWFSKNLGLSNGPAGSFMIFPWPMAPTLVRVSSWSLFVISTKSMNSYDPNWNNKQSKGPGLKQPGYYHCPQGGLSSWIATSQIRVAEAYLCDHSSSHQEAARDLFQRLRSTSSLGCRLVNSSISADECIRHHPA